MADIEKSLIEIVEMYPAVLDDDKKLKSILKDYFPEDKRIQNHLYMVCEQGILEDMKGATEINKYKMVRYIHRLADDYGISESMAKEAIVAWTKALKIKAEEVSISESRAKQNQDSIIDGNSAINFEIEDENTLHFSGKEGRIIPNIKLMKGTYAVKLKGDIFFKLVYCDYKINQKMVIGSVYREEECIFKIERNIDNHNPGYFEIQNRGDDNLWTVDVVKLD